MDANEFLARYPERNAWHEIGLEAGDLIGHTKAGKPIYLQGGGDPNTFEAWIPEEFDSKVIQRVNQASAVESMASEVPMKSDTKSVPRSAGVGVEFIAKSGTYGEDASTNDEVVLTAKKFGKAIRIAEEDLDDSLANIIATKQGDWATSYAKEIDNATLATTAAASSTVPFTSVYKVIHTTDSSVSYTADDNLTQSSTAGVVTYDDLSKTFGKVEDGDYFDEASMFVIAHTGFRRVLREIKDDQHRPIFVQGLAGTPDTLFGLTVKWSMGAKTSALPTTAPTGNPLLIVVNKNFLLLGKLSGPESMISNGPSFLSDEQLLKMRARRGFALGHPKAASVYEKLPTP